MATVFLTVTACCAALLTAVPVRAAADAPIPPIISSGDLGLNMSFPGNETQFENFMNGDFKKSLGLPPSATVNQEIAAAYANVASAMNNLDSVLSQFGITRMPVLPTPTQPTSLTTTATSVTTDTPQAAVPNANDPANPSGNGAVWTAGIGAFFGVLISQSLSLFDRRWIGRRCRP